MIRTFINEILQARESACTPSKSAQQIKRIKRALQSHNLLDKKCVQMLDTLENTADSPLKIAVIGQFSSGKSTFLNALLGEELLPSGIIPITSKICEISYGRHLSLEILYKNGTSRFQSLGFLEHTDSKDEAITSFKIYAPLEILKKISFFDTPGFNSQNQSDTDTTNTLLNGVDGIIWLSLIDNVGKLSEKEILHTHIKKYSAKSLCVLNQKDRLKDLAEVQMSLEYAKSAFDGVFSRFVAISAKEALVGLKTKDTNIYDHSGIQEVLDFLHNELMPNVSDIKEAKITRELRKGLLAIYCSLRAQEKEIQEYEHAIARYCEGFSKGFFAQFNAMCLKQFDALDSLLDEIALFVFANFKKQEMEFTRRYKVFVFERQKKFFKEILAFSKDEVVSMMEKSSLMLECKKLNFKLLSESLDNLPSFAMPAPKGLDDSLNIHLAQLISQASLKLQAQISAFDTLWHTNFSYAFKSVCVALEYAFLRGIALFKKDPEKFPLYEPNVQNIREMLNEAFHFEIFSQKLFLQNNLAKEISASLAFGSKNLDLQRLHKAKQELREKLSFVRAEFHSLNPKDKN